MGTLWLTPVIVGFKKGPQYLFHRAVPRVVQMGDDPKNFTLRIRLDFSLFSIISPNNYDYP